VEIDEIIEIENRYHDESEQSLGRAHAALLDRWTQGLIDRETCLHLMFLTWYACSEPGVLTGLPDEAWMPSLFADAFERLGGERTTDREVIFATCTMASRSYAHCCGDEQNWTAVGERLQRRFDELPRSQLSPDQFEGRGAYGRYFAHILRRQRARQPQANPPGA
jgi:hypothetical protein